MARYAISDIHGCAETLRVLVERELKISHLDELYILGDFIDRGPDSAGVIRYLMRLQLAGYKVTVLRGNHEQLILDAINGDRSGLNRWMNAGGSEALLSWRVQHPREIPESHLDFLKKTDFYADIPGYLLVHAGLDFTLSDPLQGLYAMLWTRQSADGWQNRLNRAWLGDRVIVHGHTPLSRKSIEAALNKLSTLPVLDIDAGCVYPRQGFGNLCALHLDTRQLTFVPRMDVM